MPLGPGRLRGISPQQTILQRGSVKPADDGVHLLRVGRFNEREALGLLRFGVTDYFYGIGDKVFSGKPRLDIIRSDPRRQVSKKYSKAHSKVSLTPSEGDCLRIPIVAYDCCLVNNEEQW